MAERVLDSEPIALDPPRHFKRIMERLAQEDLSASELDDWKMPESEEPPLEQAKRELRQRIEALEEAVAKHHTMIASIAVRQWQRSRGRHMEADDTTAKLHALERDRMNKLKTGDEVRAIGIYMEGGCAEALRDWNISPTPMEQVQCELKQLRDEVALLQGQVAGLIHRLDHA